MKLIAHRGNTRGPNPEKENTIQYIEEARGLGLDVEIDVWCFGTDWFIGHDAPDIKSSYGYMAETKNLWLHMKNERALWIASQAFPFDVHYFWHENDKFTLTSTGIIWCYPDNYCNHGIALELGKPTIERVRNIKERPLLFGICSDYILDWREALGL